jgi:hypothetical protein
MRSSHWTVPVVTALLGLASAGSALAGGPATLAEAKALAAKENKALLVDFYTEW